MAHLVCVRNFSLAFGLLSLFLKSIEAGGSHGLENHGHEPVLLAGDHFFEAAHQAMVIPWQNIDRSCQGFVEALANATSEFVYCSISHARPVHICQSCVDEYVMVQSAMRKINEDDTTDPSGATCKDILLSRDRVHVITKSYKFVEDMWSEAYCSSCFASYKDNNGTVVSELSHGAHEFEVLLDQLTQCITNITGGEGFPVNNASNMAAACIKCAGYYDKLNTHYAHMEHEAHNHVCADLMDSMNYTRIMWSEDFKCTVKKRDLIPVICLTVFFCLLPIVFYIGSKIHGVKQEREIVKQNRMATSST